MGSPVQTNLATKRSEKTCRDFVRLNLVAITTLLFPVCVPAIPQMSSAASRPTPVEKNVVEGVVEPEHFNSAGNNPYDGAASLSNIRDTCYGNQAKRSSYGVAPGGCVCLKESMLEVMFEYAMLYHGQTGKAIQVNAIAGSEHSANSWHYQGNTMDVACTTPTNHCNQLVDFCRDHGAIELCYPGSSCGGHETWVHCAF